MLPFFSHSFLVSPSCLQDNRLFVIKPDPLHCLLFCCPACWCFTFLKDWYLIGLRILDYKTFPYQASLLQIALSVCKHSLCKGHKACRGKQKSQHVKVFFPSSFMTILSFQSCVQHVDAFLVRLSKQAVLAGESTAFGRGWAFFSAICHLEN